MTYHQNAFLGKYLYMYKPSFQRAEFSVLNSELKLDAHVSFVNFTSGSFGYAVQLVGDFGTASLGWSDTEIYFDRAEAGKWRRVWTINPPAAKV